MIVCKDLIPLTNKIIRRKSTQIFVTKMYIIIILAESLLNCLDIIPIVCNDKFRLNDIQPYETFKGVF